MSAAAPETAAAAAPVVRHETGLPRIDGPIPTSASSYPFNAADWTRTPIDLAARNYVEEEYFQSGVATVYDWPAAGRLTSIGAGPYTTRILVRRPKDLSSFNGAVIVEPLNSSHMADVDLMWIYSHDYLMAQGYAWVGVTVKPVSGAALKRFDPQRYAPISFASPLPAARRCPDPELGPTDTSTEIGLAFDALSQLGALLRSDAPQNPLRAYRPSRVYMTGYSQTAGYSRTYATAISPFVTGPRGRRIYDGYLAGGQGPFNVVLNTCTPPFKPGDPRLMVGALGAPYLDVSNEGDTLQTHFMRRRDSDKAPDLFRRYEVAGSTHSGSWLDPFTPLAADFARAGGRDTSVAGCDPEAPPLSDFPLRYVMDAMWRNLDAWVTNGIPPPRAAYLRLDEGRNGPATRKDQLSNAIGGVRTVATEVPVATWRSSRGGPLRCMLIGYGEPFDRAKLKALYPTHAVYVAKVKASARRLVAQRWLTPAGAADIVSTAERAAIP